MSLLARWHLRRAETLVDAARDADEWAASMLERPRQARPADVALRTLDASAAWVRAVECLLYAAGLP